MKPRAVGLVLVVVSVVSLLAAPAFAGEPVRIAGTSRADLFPAGSDGYIAWETDRFPHGTFRSTVWVQPTSGGDPVRFAGPDSSMGGLDGSILAYATGEGLENLDTDIVLTDLATGEDVPLPEGINTPNVETFPSISGTRLLFDRERRLTDRVVLADLTTGEQTVVFSRTDSDRRFTVFERGQVNGDFAVWNTILVGRNGLIGGDVWLYDIAAATTTKISEGKTSWEYGASVSADGTVYFGRSGLSCGRGATVIARALDGSEQVLYELARGRDFTSTFAVDTATGTDLLADFGDCNGDQGDIWRLSGV